MTRPAGPPSPAVPRADTPDSLRPPSADRVGRGAVVSTVVHLGLVGALALGVSWNAEAPTPVSAELWSAVPEVAAPPAAGEPNAAPPAPAPAPVPTPAPPPPPPPPAKVAPPPPPPPPKAVAPSPRDAQIALEREKREKERERQEQLAAEKARAERLAKEKAEKAERAEQERQAKLKEQREQADKERRAKAEAEEKRAKAEEAEKRAKAAEAEKRAKAAEAEKRAKAEEADKKAKAEAQAKAAAEEKRQQALADKLRKEQMARMMGQVGGSADSPGGNGAPGSSGKGARDSGPSAGYAGRIVARVKPNIVFGDDISGNPMAEIEVRTAPDGTIIGRKVARSSGNADWDQAVLRAVDRTGVLPRDTDGRVPAVIIIGFRPRD